MPADYKIVAKPNASLSKRGMWVVIGVVALMTLSVAIAFSLMGAWLVLPFAGLELLVVAGAFYLVQCHSDDFDSITIQGDELAVDKRRYKHTTQMVFNRYWAKVLLRELPCGELTLWLASQGREVEFGNRLLNSEQKLALAKQLRQRVGFAF